MVVVVSKSGEGVCMSWYGEDRLMKASHPGHEPTAFVGVMGGEIQLKCHFGGDTPKRTPLISMLSAYIVRNKTGRASALQCS